MKNADALLAGIILLIGIGYEGMAWWMPRGSLAYPGPGFFPVVVGVFLILTAAGCIIQALVATESKAPFPVAVTSEGPPAAPATSPIGKAWLLLGLLAAYALLLKPLGFLVAISLCLLAAIRIFGYRHWLPSLGITVLIAAISYVAFVLWLKVPLPLGILADLLD